MYSLCKARVEPASARGKGDKVVDNPGRNPGTEGFQLRDPGRIAHQEIGELEDAVGTLSRGEAGPRSLLEGRFGGGHGAVDILCIGCMDVGGDCRASPGG